MQLTLTLLLNRHCVVIIMTFIHSHTVLLCTHFLLFHWCMYHNIHHTLSLCYNILYTSIELILSYICTSLIIFIVTVLYMYNIHDIKKHCLTLCGVRFTKSIGSANHYKPCSDS